MLGHDVVGLLLASGSLHDSLEDFLEARDVDVVLVERLVAEIGVLDSAHLQVAFTQCELTSRLALAAVLGVRVEHEGYYVPDN